MHTEYYLREANQNDIPQMLSIYSPFVEHTPVSLELETPTVEEFRDRLHKYQSKWAWIVAEKDGEVLGYAYASPHRERLAYKWSVETSVYVHEKGRGQGLGTLLYQSLLTKLTELGYCNALAIIVLPNENSERFHESLGFQKVGCFPRAGFKFNTWHDVGWYVLKLRDLPPEGEL